MGLYGALTKMQANNRAYQGVDTHNSEATLLFSEVDPVLHDAVATGNYGPGLAVSSTTGYRARYFLINGQSYTNGMRNQLAGAHPGRQHSQQQRAAKCAPALPQRQPGQPCADSQRRVSAR